MGSPAAVSVNNDLTAGETSVGLWATDDEAAGGLDVVDCVLVEHFGGDDLVHNLETVRKCQRETGLPFL